MPRTSKQLARFDFLGFITISEAGTRQDAYREPPLLEAKPEKPLYELRRNC